LAGFDLNKTKAYYTVRSHLILLILSPKATPFDYLLDLAFFAAASPVELQVNIQNAGQTRLRIGP
jgi:hypothetical protein